MDPSTLVACRNMKKISIEQSIRYQFPTFRLALYKDEIRGLVCSFSHSVTSFFVFPWRHQNNCPIFILPLNLLHLGLLHLLQDLSWEGTTILGSAIGVALVAVLSQSALTQALVWRRPEAPARSGEFLTRLPEVTAESLSRPKCLGQVLGPICFLLHLL